MSEREIRAVYDGFTIRIYQAYPNLIADEALMLGTFGNHFKMNRMTWIKPSFLWMMSRCGWARKENQERVLAIDIKREYFNEAVKLAVSTTYSCKLGTSQEEWKQRLIHSNYRIQWDPEKDVNGNDLPFRSLQLGIKGDALLKYISEWIVDIYDITDYVVELNKLRLKGYDIISKLPVERTYEIK